MKRFKAFQSAAQNCHFPGVHCSCLSLGSLLNMICRRDANTPEPVVPPWTSQQKWIPTIISSFSQSVLKWWLICVLWLAVTSHPGWKSWYCIFQDRSGLYWEGGWVMLNESWMSPTGSSRKTSLEGDICSRTENFACSKDNIAFCLFEVFYTL